MSDLPFITSLRGPLDWITLLAVRTLLRKREPALGTPRADERNRGEGSGALRIGAGAPSQLWGTWGLEWVH